MDELGVQGFLDKISGERQKILENHRLDDLLSKMEEDIRRKSMELEQLLEKLKDPAFQAVGKKPLKAGTPRPFTIWIGSFPAPAKKPAMRPAANYRP